MNDYKDDLIIDKSNLDEECIAQPVLLDIYGTKEIYAEDDLQRAKDAYEVVRATRDLYYRGMSINEINEKFNLLLVKPPTESLLLSILNTDEEVQDALHDVNTARFAMKLTTRIKRDFEERSVSLSNLVKLHGQGYFSEVKGEGKNMAHEKLKKKLSEAVREEAKQREPGKAKTKKSKRVKK